MLKLSKPRLWAMILFWLNDLDRDYDLTKLAPALCHRNFGIGSDGSDCGSGAGLYKMTMLNPDGSVAMCGNGLRAFVLYLANRGW